MHPGRWWILTSVCKLFLWLQPRQAPPSHYPDHWRWKKNIGMTYHCKYQEEQPWTYSSMSSWLGQAWYCCVATIFTTRQINPALWLTSSLELVLTSWPMGSLRECTEVGQLSLLQYVDSDLWSFLLSDEILKSQFSLWLSPSSSRLMYATFNYSLVQKKYIIKQQQQN